jgi:hypothetical protein
LVKFFVNSKEFIAFAGASSADVPSLMLGLMGNHAEPVTGTFEVPNVTSPAYEVDTKKIRLLGNMYHQNLPVGESLVYI